MKTFANDNSGNLFNHLIDNFGLKNDRRLGIALDVQAPVISKVRNGKLGVSAETILRVHEKLGLPVNKIRALIAKEAA